MKFIVVNLQKKIKYEEFALIYRDLSPEHMVRSSFLLLLASFALITFVFATMNFLHCTKYNLLLIFTVFVVYLLTGFLGFCDIVRKIAYWRVYTIAVQKNLRLGIILLIILEIMFFFSRYNCDTCYITALENFSFADFANSTGEIEKMSYIFLTKSCSQSLLARVTANRFCRALSDKFNIYSDEFKADVYNYFRFSFKIFLTEKKCSPVECARWLGVDLAVLDKHFFTKLFFICTEQYINEAEKMADLAWKNESQNSGSNVHLNLEESYKKTKIFLSKKKMHKKFIKVVKLPKFKTKNIDLVRDYDYYRWNKIDENIRNYTKAHAFFKAFFFNRNNFDITDYETRVAFHKNILLTPAPENITTFTGETAETININSDTNIVVDSDADIAAEINANISDVGTSSDTDAYTDYDDDIENRNAGKKKILPIKEPKFSIYSPDFKKFIRDYYNLLLKEYLIEKNYSLSDFAKYLGVEFDDAFENNLFESLFYDCTKIYLTGTYNIALQFIGLKSKKLSKNVYLIDWLKKYVLKSAFEESRVNVLDEKVLLGYIQVPFGNVLTEYAGDAFNKLMDKNVHYYNLRNELEDKLGKIANRTSSEASNNGEMPDKMLEISKKRINIREKAYEKAFDLTVWNYKFEEQHTKIFEYFLRRIRRAVGDERTAQIFFKSYFINTKKFDLAGIAIHNYANRSKPLKNILNDVFASLK